jgi:hypothetical protein
MVIMNFDLQNTDWNKIKNGTGKYSQIMRLVMISNVQTDKCFQKAFNGFYRIRQRSNSFYRALYGYLEKNKNKKTSFEQTLVFFYRKFKRFEPSFSSKIVATINPNFPVWDSVVINKLRIKVPERHLSQEVRFKKTVKIYGDIVKWYVDFLKTKEARRIIKIFDKMIDTPNITDTKKIDLIIWQTRS